MDKDSAFFLLAIVVCVGLVRRSNAHGRLMEPTGRASLWRFGFDCPTNYNDHELFCGGFSVQWNENDGQCGICGDNWAGPRDNEAGGKYACGIISKYYEQGQIINITVEITVFHNGWFEFRLCPHNDVNVPATHECLNRYLLKLGDGTETRWSFPAGSNTGWYSVMALLPDDVTCDQCILQWKWHAGNTWGTDPASGSSCVGCGPQEEFYGCADIGISSMSVTGSTRMPQSTQMTQSSQMTQSTKLTQSTHMTQSTQVTRSTPKAQSCRAIGAWAANPGSDVWCTENCKIGHCPSKFCACD